MRDLFRRDIRSPETPGFQSAGRGAYSPPMKSDSTPEPLPSSGDKAELAPGNDNVSRDRPAARKSTRRLPNEVDFWRGYALIAIYFNHIPGLFFERFTHRNFGVSDSSELFVFLAGFSLRYLSESRSENLVGARLVMRLEGRAFTIYAAQILITTLALGLLSAAAIALDTPLPLQWHNASSFFENPVATQIGIVTLMHQMGYFNILPLYVVLMAAAPLIVVLFRLSPTLLFGLSATLWIVTLWSGVNIVTWPIEGRWFFDPLAWQFVFVLGFLLARPVPLTSIVQHHRRALRYLSVVIVLVGVAITIPHWRPSPFDVPDPKLFFIDDKAHLSPMRLVHLLALVALFGGVIERALRWPRFAAFASAICALGRNSLHVFCAGSLLSLCGQLVRFAGPIDLLTDTFVAAAGIAIMFAIAWANEWRINLAR